MKRKIHITDTTLRDAHQSLWATRMRTEDIAPVLDLIDNAGYYSLECWGGATFDVCLRFLREDPWERLRFIKKRTKTPLQMLLRGQNILGYKNYPDDVLVRFIELSAKNGIDIFRIFDALNDTRNLEMAIKTVRRVGAHAQGTISYTSSPVHTMEKYLETAKELEALGADSICIKDMAGILAPSVAKELAEAFAGNLSIPVQIHSHMTSGMALLSYCSAVDGGAGAVDGAVSSLSGISSQPPTETIAAVLHDRGYDTGLDLEAIGKISRHFKALRPQREPSSASRDFVDAGVLSHHIPGGMISNLRSQLEQQGALDRIEEVMAELPRVRADMGYPPLVTPTSQIIGIQAVLNVLSQERYNMVTEETRNYVRGLYGRSPMPVGEDVCAKILGDEKQISCRPADLIAPGLALAASEIPKGMARQEEDILSYALFPEVALDYFRWRNLPEGTRPPAPADLEKPSMASQEKKTVQADDAPSPGKTAPGGKVVRSSLSGTFYRKAAPDKPAWAEEGASLKKGETVCAVEAMKLLNSISAPEDCTIEKFHAENGKSVAKGDILFSYR